MHHNFDHKDIRGKESRLRSDRKVMSLKMQFLNVKNGNTCVTMLDTSSAHVQVMRIQNGNWKSI